MLFILFGHDFWDIRLPCAHGSDRTPSPPPPPGNFVKLKGVDVEHARPEVELMWLRAGILIHLTDFCGFCGCTPPRSFTRSCTGEIRSREIKKKSWVAKPSTRSMPVFSDLPADTHVHIVYMMVTEDATLKDACALRLSHKNGCKMVDGASEALLPKEWKARAMGRLQRFLVGQMAWYAEDSASRHLRMVVKRGMLSVCTECAVEAGGKWLVATPDMWGRDSGPAWGEVDAEPRAPILDWLCNKLEKEETRKAFGMGEMIRVETVYHSTQRCHRRVAVLYVLDDAGRIFAFDLQECELFCRRTKPPFYIWGRGIEAQEKDLLHLFKLLHAAHDLRLGLRVEKDVGMHWMDFAASEDGVVARAASDGALYCAPVNYREWGGSVPSFRKLPFRLPGRLGAGMVFGVQHGLFAEARVAPRAEPVPPPLSEETPDSKRNVRVKEPFACSVHQGRVHVGYVTQPYLLEGYFSHGVCISREWRKSELWDEAGSFLREFHSERVGEPGALGARVDPNLGVVVRYAEETVFVDAGCTVPHA